MLCVRETPCDLYIICRGSHYFRCSGEPSSSLTNFFIFFFNRYSQSKDVTVRFYLDVHDVQRDSNVTTASVTSILQAATNGSFRPLQVEFISLEYVVVGELSLISEERLCEREKERDHYRRSFSVAARGWLLKAWLALSIG